MAWTCPACHLPIRHSDREDRRRAGVTYRCHVCRLELVVDMDRGKLTLAPLPPGQVDHGNDTNKRATRRTNVANGPERRKGANRKPNT